MLLYSRPTGGIIQVTRYNLPIGAYGYFYVPIFQKVCYYGEEILTNRGFITKIN